MNVTCHVCRHENRSTARCCTACGADLVRACPHCETANKAAARFCVQCGHALPPDASPARSVADPAAEPAAGAAPAQTVEPGEPPPLAARLPPAVMVSPSPVAEPLEFAFDPPPAPPWPARVAQSGSVRRTPWEIYVGGCVALLVFTGAAVWYTLVRPGAARDVVPPVPAVPTAAPAAVAPPPAVPVDATAARAEPVEEFIEPERPRAAVVPLPVPAAAPAPEAPFTPVTVPRVPDAVPQPGAARPRPAAAPEDAPWPPVVRPAPAHGDGLAALRQGLAQCAAMGNELSRSTCLARMRHNFCGNAWGRIPECPQGL